MGTSLNQADIIGAASKWVETMVIGLNLCPFARKEWVSNRVRLSVSIAKNEADLLVDLDEELSLLQSDSSLETTLLIHPGVLQEFADYNQFLSKTDVLLDHRGFKGVYQIASFHPNYQFEGTDPEDVENATNQSPYPILHVLKERSVSRAIASHTDVLSIPQGNMQLLRKMGKNSVSALLQACFDFETSSKK